MHFPSANVGVRASAAGWIRPAVSLTTRGPYVRNIGLKTGEACRGEAFCCLKPFRGRHAPVFGQRVQRRQGLKVAFAAFCLSVVFPSASSATHEADHRFTVEGFVCGTDGKAIADTDVLVKDTKISYGQVVKTDGDGYYKATFHLHNENLGDPLLVEARGEQKNHKVFV